MSLALALHTSTSKEPYYQYPNNKENFKSGIYLKIAGRSEFKYST